MTAYLVTTAADIGLDMIRELLVVARDFIALKVMGAGLGIIGLKLLAELI